MKKEILQNLDSFDDNEYHELNGFLTDNFQQESLTIVRKNFTFLQNFKLIEVNEATGQYLNLPILSPVENNTVTTSLDNLLFKAKITNKGRKICEEIKNSVLPSPKKIEKQNSFVTYFVRPALVLSTVILFWKYLQKFYRKNSRLKYGGKRKF